MNRDAKIYVAGHEGLAGSALLRRLKNDAHVHVLVRTHAEPDLTNQSEVREFFSQQRPEYVFLAAAKVGGILANSTYSCDRSIPDVTRGRLASSSFVKKFLERRTLAPICRQSESNAAS